jgi:hypothetical protein
MKWMPPSLLWLRLVWLLWLSLLQLRLSLLLLLVSLSMLVLLVQWRLLGLLVSLGMFLLQGLLSLLRWLCGRVGVRAGRRRRR